MIALAADAAVAQDGSRNTRLQDFGVTTPSNLAGDNTRSDSLRWDNGGTRMLPGMAGRDLWHPDASRTRSLPIVRQFGEEGSTCVALHAGTVCN